MRVRYKGCTAGGQQYIRISAHPARNNNGGHPVPLGDLGHASRSLPGKCLSIDRALAGEDESRPAYGLGQTNRTGDQIDAGLESGP